MVYIYISKTTKHMNIQKYESVKLTVEAVQFTGSNFQELRDFMGKSVSFNEVDETPMIYTKEGRMDMAVNDWAVKEPFPTGDRDFYPVKAEIFANRYRPAGHKKSNAYFFAAVIAITCLLTGAVAGYMYGITHPF